MSHTSANPGSSVLDFAALLGTLGFTADEFVSLGYQKPGGAFRTAVMAPADAVTTVAEASTTANLYFGVNPIKGTAPQGRRARQRIRRDPAGRAVVRTSTSNRAAAGDLESRPRGHR